MSQVPQVGPADFLRAERESLRRSWFWLLLLGVLLILVGMGAIAYSYLATLATLQTVGILLLVGAGVAVVNAVWARGWRGFWTHLLAGILYLVLGVFFLERPIASATTFTLALAAVFMISGLVRILAAVSARFHGWFWVFLNGIVTLVLGVMIWQHWPEDSYWVIGLFVGIDMLFVGWSLVMASLAVRSVAHTPV
jgi:uncharacterized membrane protein HdeD (DUF308 family)